MEITGNLQIKYFHGSMINLMRQKIKELND
jgi:hypothetical protein